MKKTPSFSDATRLLRLAVPSVASTLAPALLPALLPVLLPAVAYAQPCGGLVTHISFDGATVNDLSGMGNNGVAVRTSGVNDGRSREGVRTSRASNSYVQMGNSPSLNSPTGLTLSAWVRNPVFSTGNDAIIDKGASSHSPPYYQYHLGLASGFSFDLAIGGVRRFITSGTAYSGWQHVVGTYNGSQMRIYTDGQLRNSLNISGNITSYNSPVRIGAFTNLSTISTSADIDEVRIYNRGLSADEVRFLYESPGGTPLVREQSTSACVGSTLTLNVSHIGGTAFLWRKDGQPIDPAVNPTSVTSTLEIVTEGGISAGVYDVIVSNACNTTTSAPVYVTLCACLSCPADFNQDGGIDGSDVTEFFVAWSSGGCDGDTNADGGVDGSDVTTFFEAWVNAGC
jgi:hypothetical protein